MNNAVCAMGDPMFVARVHDLEGELRDARRALRAEVERLIDELAPRIHEAARPLPVLGPVGGLGVPLQKLADNHQRLYLAVRQDTEIELLGHDGTHLTPIADDQLAAWLDEEPALLFERSIEETAAKRPKLPSVAPSGPVTCKCPYCGELQLLRVYMRHVPGCRGQFKKRRARAEKRRARQSASPFVVKRRPKVTPEARDSRKTAARTNTPEKTSRGKSNRSQRRKRDPGDATLADLEAGLARAIKKPKREYVGPLEGFLRDPAQVSGLEGNTRVLDRLRMAIDVCRRARN